MIFQRMSKRISILNILTILVLLLLCALTANLFFIRDSNAASDSKNLNPRTVDVTRIENLIQQKLPNTPVGIFLQDANTGKILYERRAQETFLPASTAKLITAATSLFSLGPQYQYETAVKGPDNANAIKNGILTGNLYFVFSGDPSLTTDNLKTLVKELKTQGLKQINGNVMIDDSLFKGRPYPYGWMADDLTWYFAAPVSTVIIDENKIKILVKSNQTLGQKATVALAAEETLPLKISQDVVSVTETDAKENCDINVKLDPDNNIQIKGCWPAKEKDDELKVAVQNPNMAATQILKQILKSEGIQWNGKVEVGIAPQAAKTLAVHRSEPLETLLKPVLQDSNNLYTETLVKAMGVKQFNQGSFQAGLRAMKTILNNKFGIDPTGMRLQDGSGDSRYDAVTPAQLGRVLYVMYHNPDFGKLFRETLPNSGNTGSLKTRMSTFDVNEIIQAKTGSMTGVSTLAGYIGKSNLQNPQQAKADNTASPDMAANLANQPNEQGQQTNQSDLIFVIMINGAVGDSAASKQLENELCMLFVK